MPIRLSSALKKAIEKRELSLVARYGELLTMADIAQVFRYSSRQAVRLAHLNGSLPFQLIRIANRRGWFATARAVATVLAEADKDCLSTVILQTKEARTHKSTTK